MTDHSDRKTRIDVHSHFIPPFYRDALAAAGVAHPDGIKALPDWSEDIALKAMDALGIQASVLSISSPGIRLGPNPRQANELAERVNDFAAGLKKRRKGRFGYLASVPLPDVDASIREAERALDALDADGIIVQSNYGGHYLGDQVFEPFWAALDKRSAVVLVHPTAPAAQVSQRLAKAIPQPAMEFFFDATRSLIDLITAGVLERHGHLKILVSHAGAALPVLANRIDLALPALASGGTPPPSVQSAMRLLHFDLAGAPVPELLAGLLSLADPAKLHYASDFPFTSQELAVKLLNDLEATGLLDEDTKNRVDTSNSLALFPRLATV